MSDQHSEIKLAPTTQFRLGGSDSQSIELWVGSGGERERATFDDPKLVGTLLQLRKPARRSTAIELFAAELGHPRDRAEALLRMLEERRVIVPAATESPYASLAAQKWIKWGWRDALDYHLAVRDLPFAAGDDDGYSLQNAALRDMIVAGQRGDDLPSPGPYKDYPGAERIALPRSRALIDAASVGKALYKRRTCRKFGKRVIELARFAELVEHSFGAINEWDMGAMGTHLRRTSPSGGARHPVEVYTVVNHVEGLEPGLYHYSVRDHALELVRRGDFSTELYELGHQQTGLRDVSAAFFYTARWDRHIWKYRYARSYRMVLFDIAHLVQTTLVTATALDLRSFLTPALKDTETTRFLGLEDLAESPLYVTSVG